MRLSSRNKSLSVRNVCSGSTLSIHNDKRRNPKANACACTFTSWIERARMARTEVEGQRSVLSQARQCISLDRGHGQGAALRRSIREAELAEDSQHVCAWGDFHK